MAWAAICEHKIPALALRTLGGGPADKAGKSKAESLANLIEKSACRSATEFNARLAASEPAIQTTIGGTASLAHLEEFLAAAEKATPLAPTILEAARALQRN